MKRLEEALRKATGTLRQVHDALKGERYGEHWLSHIDDFLSTAESMATTPQSCYELGISMISIYGGMGSFNDTAYAKRTENLKSELYESIQELLRASWQSLGRKVHEIPPSAQLRTGDSVRLIFGEVISMRPTGETTTAPRSRLDYRVREVHSPDIDGMPIYFIQSDSHCWLARHNALTKT